MVRSPHGAQADNPNYANEEVGNRVTRNVLSSEINAAIDRHRGTEWFIATLHQDP